MLILMLVFSTGSPVKERAWACADAADAACAAVLRAADPAQGFCALARDQWYWTQPRATLTAQFDLVCGGEGGAAQVGICAVAGWAGGGPPLPGPPGPDPCPAAGAATAGGR
jgi:hypothetical protein